MQIENIMPQNLSQVKYLFTVSTNPIAG